MERINHCAAQGDGENYGGGYGNGKLFWTTEDTDVTTHHLGRALLNVAIGCLETELIVNFWLRTSSNVSRRGVSNLIGRQLTELCAPFYILCDHGCAGISHANVPWSKTKSGATGSPYKLGHFHDIHKYLELHSVLFRSMAPGEPSRLNSVV